ncbi:ABC transporter ATP-binding protein [Longibaculum muris]|uniref:ABC transporter ATP-binding protein n=1 Tax=Longibaculum muris TaxID=1796628 RepID=UPI0022E8AD01|nr:ABC transporter ATP-binding protein [Longibaculum muris]
MDKCIEVKDLTKIFEARKVVDQLSFDVNVGEVYGILGHNGAGKTTTIESILGLNQPDCGYALIFGKNARKERKTLFERIGVQLQVSYYQDNIKVIEVCEEIAALYQNPADYHQLLHQFQLDTFKNQYVDQLSGGEKQKLSLVVALIPQPEIIFLDELTTGLDVVARREVWNILKNLKEKGMTIVLTTHYMEEAQYLCDRILLLKQGKKVVEGTVNDIMQSGPYQNLEEAYLTLMEEKQ